MEYIFREGKAVLLNIGSTMRMKSNGAEECGDLRSREGFHTVLSYDDLSTGNAPMIGWHFPLTEILVLAEAKAKSRVLIGRHQLFFSAFFILIVLSIANFVLFRRSYIKSDK